MMYMAVQISMPVTIINMPHMMITVVSILLLVMIVVVYIYVKLIMLAIVAVN